MKWLSLGSLICILLALHGGCASERSGSARAQSSPYATPDDAARNPLRAQELNHRAIELMADDPDRAEKLLRQALAADLFFGPAHNNLGVMHLQQGRLYEAAHEFEWARKLLPGHPDPRVNLALTLERAGRVDDAFAAYDSALEVYPDDLAAMQGLARLQVRTKRTDERTERFLEEIALRSSETEWQAWAHRAQRKLEQDRGEFLP